MLGLKSLKLVPLSLQSRIVEHLHFFIRFLLGSFQLFLFDQHSKKLSLSSPGDTFKHSLRGVTKMLLGVFLGFWHTILRGRIQVVSHFLEYGTDLGSRHRYVVRVDDIYLIELFHGLFENLARLKWKQLDGLWWLHYLCKYFRTLVSAWGGDILRASTAMLSSWDAFWR